MADLRPLNIIRTSSPPTADEIYRIEIELQRCVAAIIEKLNNLETRVYALEHP